MPFPAAIEGRSFARHWSPIHLDFAVEDLARSTAEITRLGGSVEGRECFRDFDPGKVIVPRETDARVTCDDSELARYVAALPLKHAVDRLSGKFVEDRKFMDDVLVDLSCYDGCVVEELEDFEVGG